MSEIKSLSIKGIRAFHPNPSDMEKQTIEFNGPVTLITGANGAGKTTVIEALCYATTGKTKKKAITAEFLHDPRMWGNKTVNSEVKLTIQDVNGKEKIITRRAKLDVTSKSVNSGIALKTLDSSITDENCKNDHTINEINLEIPKLMGVSQAILENVIFCHQDDACWPIESNSKNLKERFDTIFGAEQYDNAIKDIKVNIKKWKDSIIEKEKREAVLSTIQSQRDETEVRMKSIREEVNRLRDELKEKEKIENDLKDRVSNVKANSKVIEECKNAITLCQERIRTKNKEICEIETATGPNHPSFEECRVRFSTLESEHSSVKERLNYYQSEITKIENLSVQINKALPSKNEELNKKREMMSDGDRQRQIYDSTLREFKEQFNTDNYEEMLQNLDLMAKSQKKSLESQKHEIEEENKKYESDKQTYENSLKVYESKKSGHEGSIRMIEQEINRYPDCNEESLSKINQELTNANEKLVKESQDMESAERLRIRQQQIAKRRQEITKENKDIQSKIDQCNEQSTLEQEITNATISMNHCQGEIEQILQTLKDGLNDPDIDQYTAEIKLAAVMDETKRKRLEATKNKDKSNKDLLTCENFISMKTKELNDIKKRIADDTCAIESAIGTDNYEEIYFRTKKALEDVNAEITRLSNSEAIYKNFREEAQKPECSCPLCRRPFYDEDERNTFIRDFIDQVIKDLPMMLQNARERKAKLEYDLEQIEKIRPVVERKARLTAQSQHISDEINDATEQKQKLIENNNKFVIEHQTAEENYLRIRSLEQTGSQLANAVRNCINAELKLNQLASKRTPGLPLKEELEKKKQNIENERDSLIIESDQITQKLDEARAIVDELRNQINELNGKKEHIQSVLNGRREMNSNMDKMNNEIAEFNQTILQLKSEINSLTEQHSNDVSTLQKKLENDQKDLDSLKQQYQDCYSFVKRLNEARSKLEVINAGKLPQEIDSLIEEIKRMNNTLKEQNESVNKFREMRDTAQNQMDDAVKEIELFKKHELYYKVKQERDKEEAALEKNEQKLKSLNISQDDLNIDRLQNEYKDASVAVGSCRTAYLTYENNLRTIMNEFDRNESIPMELTKIRIDIRARIMALEDLTLFKTKLEETLLEYHARKLKEINDTIAELWSDTYYGHDLESIMIKTEGKAGNSAYKYMVVMKKDGVEVEMSNRCSAGQKMLASLIIRLALAQAFSSNCGIIALDEPTTNLDVENMSNFASRLSELVRKRSRKTNFQMIIITHSQEFVNLLARDMDIDHFYQITKESDGEHHFSQISRKKSDYLTLGQG